MLNQNIGIVTIVVTLNIYVDSVVLATRQAVGRDRLVVPERAVLPIAVSMGKGIALILTVIYHRVFNTPAVMKTLENAVVNTVLSTVVGKAAKIRVWPTAVIGHQRLAMSAPMLVL